MNPFNYQYLRYLKNSDISFLEKETEQNKTKQDISKCRQNFPYITFSIFLYILSN